jgi:hypothetical protein
MTDRRVIRRATGLARGEAPRGRGRRPTRRSAQTDDRGLTSACVQRRTVVRRRRGAARTARAGALECGGVFGPWVIPVSHV